MDRQQKLPVLAYRNFAPMPDMSPSHELYASDQHYFNTMDPSQGSFDHFPIASSTSQEEANSSEVDKSKDAYSPWLPGASSCGSPVSMHSTLCHSERAITPLNSNQLQFMDYQFEPSMAQRPSGSNSHSMWLDYSDQNWLVKCSQGDPWAARTVYPSWNNSSSNYDSVSMPVMGYPFYSGGSTSLPMMLAAQNQSSNNQVIDSVSSKQGPCSASSGEGDSDDESEPEEDDSGAGHARIDSRNYRCPFFDKPDIRGQTCDQCFNRPEHLRRHVKTKHGSVKEYICKVPECHIAFSRGDNLRDHYWTHLHRGGRRGKNKKMTLEELKEILGPKEKKLVKKLKEKLRKHKPKYRANLHTGAVVQLSKL